MTYYIRLLNTLSLIWHLLCSIGYHRWSVIDFEWDWIVVGCKTCGISYKEYIPFNKQPALNTKFICKSKGCGYRLSTMNGIQMNYKFILSILFIFEMVVGALLVGFGIFSHPMNMITVALGASVFAAHAIEYMLLRKMQ
jgi:hypothetical protein